MRRSAILPLLHALLMFYSLSGVLSKLASGQEFLSWGFVACYAGIIGILGVYAIGWQQIIKRIPLTTAYANRAITIVWGIVWGLVLFNEPVTPLKALGAVIVVSGVALYSTAEPQTRDGESA